MKKLVIKIHVVYSHFATKRRLLQMKNEIIWVKTILSVYRYLERICGAIDKIILKSALNSFNVSGQNYFYNNVFSISQKLLDLSDRKITLINLKILTEETLTEIDELSAKILIEKYFDSVKSKEIASNHNFSMRTLFRKILKAEKTFYSRLQAKGYDVSKIEELLKHETWIYNVYDRLSGKDDQEFTLSKIEFAKAVSM